MKFLKEADFRKRIKNCPTGAYLFFGEEDYMKSAAILVARTAVLGDAATAKDTAENLAENCFNDVRLGGMDFTSVSLADAISMPPMLAEYKLITVTGVRIDDMKNVDFEELCEVLDELSRPELDYNLVILSVDSDALDLGTLPKRPSTRLTELCERLIPVYFERNTPARLAGWVQKHYHHNGVAAEPSVCSFTVDWCGRNMYVLASEIDKVSFYVKAHDRDSVTDDDVRICATPVTEHDAFAFTNAIMARKRDVALEILGDLKSRRADPIIILSEANKVFCDLLSVKTMLASGSTVKEIASTLHMHEYRAGLYVRQASAVDVERLHSAVIACDDADKAMKLSSKGYGVLERVICSL